MEKTTFKNASEDAYVRPTLERRGTISSQQLRNGKEAAILREEVWELPRGQREREMQSQSRITLRKAMWRNWVKRKYSAIVKWLGTYHTDLSLTSRNLIVSEEHGQNSDSQRFETGARVSKKNSYYARVLASDYIQQIMASGVRYSSKNSRGIFLQMHNISSADPLWDKKKM